MKQITQMEHDMVKNPNWQEAKQLTLLQSRPWISTQKNWETNLAIGQGRTWTRRLRITSLKENVRRLQLEETSGQRPLNLQNPKLPKLTIFHDQTYEANTLKRLFLNLKSEMYL